jgi:hypothetical protein
MRKHWILCCFLLLSLIPLSCSQKEYEWRDIAKFANHEVEYFLGVPFTVVSGNSTLTEPFSVHESRLQIFWVTSPSDVETSSDNMAPHSAPLDLYHYFLTIDLYHYPDMKFVKRVVDDTGWKGDGFHDVIKSSTIVNVRKGLYCLFVSSNHVNWAVTVSECV